MCPGLIRDVLPTHVCVVSPLSDFLILPGFIDFMSDEVVSLVSAVTHTLNTVSCGLRHTVSVLQHEECALFFFF